MLNIVQQIDHERSEAVIEDHRGDMAVIALEDIDVVAVNDVLAGDLQHIGWCQVVNSTTGRRFRAFVVASELTPQLARQMIMRETLVCAA